MTAQRSRIRSIVRGSTDFAGRPGRVLGPRGSIVTEICGFGCHRPGGFCRFGNFEATKIGGFCRSFRVEGPAKLLLVGDKGLWVGVSYSADRLERGDRVKSAFLSRQGAVGRFNQAELWS